MTHKNISNAHAELLENNVDRITWNYDSGNVWSENSAVIIERYNVTNGGMKEVITVPADSLSGQSWSEELLLMCNKFSL